VRLHHAEGLLDPQAERTSHTLGNRPPKARRRLTMELPACTSCSSAL
jgi:hypothetical protein